ncbi:MAG: hypothetical protein JJT94_08440 [Bernardetiaceae bacterium]|nr:hypothetical protein [Bernardetiaceae bacterium]
MLLFRYFIFALFLLVLFGCSNKDDALALDLRSAFVGTFDVSEQIVQSNSTRNFSYTLSITKSKADDSILWLHNIGASGRSLEVRLSSDGSEFRIDRQLFSTSLNDFEVEGIGLGKVSATGELRFSYAVITRGVGDRIEVHAEGLRR